MRNTWLPLFTVCLLTACHADDSLVAAATTESSALTTAQCTYQTYDSTVSTCVSAYDTCAASADTSTCRATLLECLPSAPKEGHTACAGGPRHSRDGGDGSVTRPAPDSAALTACHDALTACVALGGADRSACSDTERSCVRDAFDEAFATQCASIETQCADGSIDADACTELTERCSNGVDAPIAVDADGGSACAQ